MKIRLHITDGDQSFDWEHSGPQVRIGRNPTAELSFRPEVNGVSWDHAIIELTSRGVFVTDLCSSNGTYVNGHRIAERTDLRSDDKIWLGKTGPKLQILVTNDGITPPVEQVAETVGRFIREFKLPARLQAFEDFETPPSADATLLRPPDRIPGLGANRCSNNQRADTHLRLMVFLFTDLVDSTGLKQRLGDFTYVECVLKPHNTMFRALLERFRSGTERDNAGDGFFVTFENLVDAVQFALLFQYRLQTKQWECETPMTRIGIHLGDTTHFQDFGALTKTAGQAQDVAARIMGLASGGQILMTRAAFDCARQNVRRHPVVDDLSTPLELRWMAHGPYLLQGVGEPMEVCEVGTVGVAPFSAPKDSPKVRRVRTDESKKGEFPWREETVVE